MPSRPELRISDDPSRDCAASIARRLRAAARRNGSAALAVSGGSSVTRLFDELGRRDVPWDRVAVWQVDERVAPDGDPDRNANHLAHLPGEHHLMPVTATNLRAAARRYARTLPARFDVVHLGMGADGHTASWPPGDPVIEASEPVALSQPYQGRVRMTLTPPVVNAAASRLVLTFGKDKAGALAAWAGPISRLRRSASVIFADPAAAGR